MQRTAILALAFGAAAARASAQDASLATQWHDLMPVPRSVAWSAGRLTLDSTFSVATAGARDQRLERAVVRMLGRLEGRIAQPLSRTLRREVSARLIVSVVGRGMPVQGIAEDESYALAVTADSAKLRAATTVGAMRGLETFLQLIASDHAGFFVPAVAIEDAPRFPWRGVLVYVGRHFMPPEVIRRTLDGMAAVKLNVLHWHLSEDQGFRVESRRYPRLQQMGSDGLYYTQAQIRDIVAYARERGIRVVPEFDMPGHATAWFVGYSRYAAGPGPYQIVRDFGIFDPVFDPTREEVYRFIDGFVGEMASLFPDAYWHVGGDEVNGKQWAANPRILAFMRLHGLANAEALQTYFNQRMLHILAAHGRRMIGWDEILKPDLPNTAMIQSWRGGDYLARAARQGYRGILSAPYYLDQQFTAEAHYLPDPLPAGSDLTPEQQALVLGGEACMWAEHVTSETIDSRIWPRLAAVAERLWSPREVSDVDDMYRRLQVTSARLEELGLEHESHSARMVRRIAPAQPQLLIELLRWTQPVTFGQRGQLQHPNQLTPLVHLVDAARPDPPGRWLLLSRVNRLAQSRDTTSLAALEGEFAAWRRLVAPIAALADSSPVIAEAAPASEALARAGAIGQEAIDSLRTGRTAGADWTAARLADLQQLDRPQGLLRLAVGDALRRVVRLAGGVADSTLRR